MGLRTSRGWAHGGADRPGRLPAAAAAPGRWPRRWRLERFAGPGGGAAGALETPPRERPARSLCVLSNYLFIEKKGGGGEKKKKSHVRVIRMWRSSRRREK